MNLVHESPVDVVLLADIAAELEERCLKPSRALLRARSKLDKLISCLLFLIYVA